MCCDLLPPKHVNKSLASITAWRLQVWRSQKGKLILVVRLSYLLSVFGSVWSEWKLSRTIRYLRTIVYAPLTPISLPLSLISVLFICHHIFCFNWGKVRLSSLGTSATIWPINQPLMMDDEEWSSRWNDWEGKPKYSEKPATVPLCPPQIPHDLTRARIRATAVGSQRLTAWAMARPSFHLTAATNLFLPCTP
jgi:hypothetical protein